MRQLLLFAFSAFALSAPAQNLSVREIARIVEVSENSEVEDIEFYQGESVQLDLYLKRYNRPISLPSDAYPVWKAWIDGAPSVLYINATGTVHNAGNGHVRVTLTPSQSNATNRAYKFSVPIYQGANYMGIGADGDLTINYSPVSGGLSYVGTVAPYVSEVVAGSGIAVTTNGSVRTIATTGAGSGDFLADGTVAMTGDLNMGGQSVTNASQFLSTTGGSVLDFDTGSYGVYIAATDASYPKAAIFSVDEIVLAPGITSTKRVRIVGDVIPSATSTYNIGSTTTNWANGYFDNIHGAGANITGLNASALASGTVPTARLGSGTASSSTFLRGDQTWATPADAIVVDLPVQSFGGPLAAETVGWEYKDEDDASTVMTFGGFTTASGTQASGTLRASFRVPADASAWRTSNAIQAIIIAESVTSTDCKYDIAIHQMDSAGINLASYTLTNQTFGSTTVPTVITIDDSTLDGAFTLVPGGWMTVEVILHTRNNLGAYLGAVSAAFVR